MAKKDILIVVMLVFLGLWNIKLQNEVSEVAKYSWGLENEYGNEQRGRLNRNLTRMDERITALEYNH